MFLTQTEKLQPNRDTVFFKDGKRRIDFVLSYVDDKDGEKKQVSVTEKCQITVSWLLSIFQCGQRLTDSTDFITQFISRKRNHKEEWNDIRFSNDTSFETIHEMNRF